MATFFDWMHLRRVVAVLRQPGPIGPRFGIHDGVAYTAGFDVVTKSFSGTGNH